MKPAFRGFVVGLALSLVWIAAGGVAEAFAPLPHSRIDPVAPESDQRIEMVYVLPEWANAELAGPLTVDEHGLGYFAGSILHLREILDGENPARGRREGDVGETKGKKADEPKGIRVGTPSGPEPPREWKRGRRGRPDDPGLGRRTETPFKDMPILPEPLERAYGKRSGGDGRPAGLGELPEPPAWTMLALALGGWLGLGRPRRRM
jgi:hypothetical protein